jgi:hypothetical protein
MHDFAGELEACLAELGAEPTEDATLVRMGPIVRESARHVVRAPRRWPLALVAVGLLLLAAVAAAAIWAVRHSGGSGQPGKAGASPPSSAAPKPVKLAAAGSFDPEGDGDEHSSKVQLVVDGDLSTHWNTEHYRSFTKHGVGLVLDVGSTRSLRRIVLTTDTAGFRAEIRGGATAQGPFPSALSRAKTIADSTTISLRPTGVRYVLVWITQLPPGLDHADVNEVKAFG